MKVIRKGVFETNSSSVHSLTMMMQDDYDKWTNDTYINLYEPTKIYTKDELINYLKEEDEDIKKESEHWSNCQWEDCFNSSEFYNHEDYYDNLDYEKFYNTFTTPNGEKVVAFGYYGYDG